MKNRRPQSPYIKGVRSMTKDDIESIRQPSARARITKLRDSHHIMARLFVTGHSLADVAMQTGYSIARVGVLRNSPAMQELIERYRSDDHEQWKAHRDATYEYMERIRLKGLRIISDALDEDQPPKLDFVLRAVDSVSDRTNYHRKSATVNINVDFAAKLEKAIAISNKTKLIEVE